MQSQLAQMSPVSTESASPPPLQQQPQQQQHVYPHACTTCVQRKVKCDKRHPCLACSKSHLQCSYRSTPPPQRRKRKIVELTRAAANQAVVDKLRSHEALLRQAGISYESFDEGLVSAQDGHNENSTSNSDNGGGRDDRDNGADKDTEIGNEPSIDPSLRLSQPVSQDEHDKVAYQQASSSNDTVAVYEPVQPALFPRQRGILIPEYGGKRYYEHALIGLLGQQYKQGPHFGWQHPPTQPENASLPSLLSGLTKAVETATSTSPHIFTANSHQLSPAVSTQYWTIFKQNVHPLTMVIHAPTTAKRLFGVMTNNTPTPSNSDSLPPAWAAGANEALKFAICACAVASLNDDECQQTFGAESQRMLLRTMQTATRQALAESKFLRLPNLDLLCAYVLLLTSMLPTTDSPSLWIMLGTAVRLAQAQGLHRDGAALGLSPFDTEMRRRLWWYIVSLESRLTEIMGAESTLPVTTSTLLPCNINDSDLDPDMTAMPAVGPGASDMMFCLVEYETVRFLQRRDPRVDRVERVKPVDRNNATSNNAAQATGAGVDTRQIVTVSGLERYLEDTFLRFCDPVIPLHLLTTAVARSLIFKLRQMGHRGQSSQSSQSYRSSFHKQILKTAARTISYDNLIHTNPSLAGFQWHVHFWFPWGSPIFVLKIMATLRTAEEWDADVQAAWQQIEALHEHHPEFSAFDADKPEYLVVGELTLKAWAARESIFGADATAGRSSQPPQLIANLQARHGIGMPAPYSWQQRKDTSVANMALANMRGRQAGDVMDTFDTASSLTAVDSMASFGDMNGFNFNLITSPFVGVDWSDWDETRMY